MKVARNYKIGGTIVVPPDPEPSLTEIQTIIKFASTPSAATASMSPQKYRKKSWLSLDWDDATPGAITAMEAMNNMFFTDGCGNNRRYTGALALNGAYEGTGVEYTYEDGPINLAMLRTMRDLGWDFMDHGYYHDPVGFGADMTPLESTQRMQAFFKRLLGYWMRSKAVPTNYSGHATAARDLGYLFSSSQGTFDGFTAEWEFAPPGDYAKLAFPFACPRRDGSDQLANDMGYLKGIIDKLTTGTNKFYRLASHTNDPVPFQEFLDYIKLKGNDSLMVVTTREVLEYREMKALPMTQSLVGDTLTLKTFLTTLDPKNRWKDMSFDIVSDQQISNVTTIGGESTSFNPTTGLVNVFKETKIW